MLVRNRSQSYRGTTFFGKSAQPTAGVDFKQEGAGHGQEPAPNKKNMAAASKRTSPVCSRIEHLKRFGRVGHAYDEQPPLGRRRSCAVTILDVDFRLSQPMGEAR